MSITKLNPSINPTTLADGRGGIYTFLPIYNNIKEWSFIVTNKDSIRGNHFHKEFDEYILFVQGSGLYLELDVTGSVIDIVYMDVGDCIYIPKLTIHTFEPFEDSKAVALLTKEWDKCKEPITKVSST